MEEKQRQLEERGVAVEKALRGEAGNSSSLPIFLFFFFSFFNQTGHPMWRCVSVIDIMAIFSELKGVISFVTQ